jgi:hypothetical protein
VYGWKVATSCAQEHIPICATRADHARLPATSSHSPSKSGSCPSKTSPYLPFQQFSLPTPDSAETCSDPDPALKHVTHPSKQHTCHDGPASSSRLVASSSHTRAADASSTRASGRASRQWCNQWQCVCVHTARMQSIGVTRGRQACAVPSAPHARSVAEPSRQCTENTGISGTAAYQSRR